MALVGGKGRIPAVILCGGLGTRLRSVIPDQPKCLAPVGGQPFLEWLLTRLERHGFKRVVLCLGYRSGQVEDFIRRRGSGEMELRWVVEAEPLGTAGAIKNAQPLLREDCFLVLNGDTILEVDYQRLIEAHCEQRALATLALRPSGSAGRYGSVRLATDGRITGFYEKAPEANAAAAEEGWISGGVYAFSQGIFERIPPAPASLETQVFPSLVGEGLHGVPCDGYFLDIGVPEDYARAQVELPARFT
jgi:D-glycero-alpha-D-manno-heptose 1-phosphate guanylyltransferase